MIWVNFNNRGKHTRLGLKAQLNFFLEIVKKAVKGWKSKFPGQKIYSNQFIMNNLKNALLKFTPILRHSRVKDLR